MKPVFIGDKVQAHCDELRDMAGWFRSRGDKENEAFLEEVADMHMEFYTAWWADKRKSMEVSS